MIFWFFFIRAEQTTMIYTYYIKMNIYNYTYYTIILIDINLIKFVGFGGCGLWSNHRVWRFDIIKIRLYKY